VAGVTVELAFRRHLSEQGIPFDVKGAAPFSEPERYDVVLGGRRCKIKSFLISHRDRIAEIRSKPQVLLRAPALVPSDQHAGDGHSFHDLYLFAFLSGWITTNQNDLQKVIKGQQPQYLVHIMPDAWNRPSQWNPLGRLAMKSESEETIIVEIGGQDKERVMQFCTVELPPRTRVEVRSEFFSLSYIHSKSNLKARIGLHSPLYKETYLVGALDWGNIWIHGMDMVLAGYITREEFRRRAAFIQAGSSVFQYDHTHVKNLAVPVSDLKPLSNLFERVKA